MTSQDLSQETKTSFLRISCLRWSVSTQSITHVWAHCGVRAHLEHRDALLSKLTEHKTTLCLSAVLFLCVCVSSHMQQTAPSVCILSIEGARCGVLWSTTTQAAVVLLPGSPCVQQPNCYNFHDEANLLKASPSLTLGRYPSADWGDASLPLIHTHTEKTYNVVSSYPSPPSCFEFKSIFRWWRWLP